MFLDHFDYIAFAEENLMATHVGGYVDRLGGSLPM